MAHAHFVCGNCGAENLVDGEAHDCCDEIDVPSEWYCWDCGELNATPY